MVHPTVALDECPVTVPDQKVQMGRAAVVGAVTLRATSEERLLRVMIGGYELELLELHGGDAGIEFRL